MIVRYIYSACVEIKTNDVRILCDPWFTSGAYHGAWHQYPLIKDPLKVIKKPNYIYISHIHPDHYDPIFLKKILKKYKNIKILIGNFKNNYLLKKMKNDGFNPKIIEHLNVKKTNIHIVNNEEDIHDIDSAIIVNNNKKTVVGLVDCVPNRNFEKKVHKIIDEYTYQVDLLMLPHSGANDYPHTHFDIKTEKKKLMKLAKKKREQNISKYFHWCKSIKSTYHLPYAGKYILGGKNIAYNNFYGLTDPVQLKKFDPKAIVLKDFGGEINLINSKINGERKKRYTKKNINKFLKKLKNKKYDYETEILIPFEKINFKSLVIKAFLKAFKTSELKTDYNFYFNLLNDKKKLNFTCMFNINTKKKPNVIFNSAFVQPGVQINIDYRLFFGLLTCLYHWNNASIGSLFTSKRMPYQYNKKALNFLNFFSL